MKRAAAAMSLPLSAPLRGTPGRVVAEAKKDYRKVLTKEDGFDIIAKLSEKQRRARRSRASEERISEKAAP